MADLPAEYAKVERELSRYGFTLEVVREDGEEVLFVHDPANDRKARLKPGEGIGGFRVGLAWAEAAIWDALISIKELFEED